MFSHPDIKEPRPQSAKKSFLSFSSADFEKAKTGENTELLEKQLQELLVFLGKADEGADFVNEELDEVEKEAKKAYVMFCRAVSRNNIQSVDDLNKSLENLIANIEGILRYRSFNLLNNGDHQVNKFMKSFSCLYP